MIREISFANYQAGSPEQRLNPETWCVSELYCSLLDSNYSTDQIRKCVIDVRKDWGSELFGSGISTVDVATIQLNFDFEKYFRIPKLEKKKMQLATIHFGMKKIAEREGWELNPLDEAYQGCLKANLEYKFQVRDKFLSSPDRKHKIGLWCEWDLDVFQVYWVLTEKNKVEIKRELFIEKPPYDGEIIYYMKWKWLDNETVQVWETFRYGNDEHWTISIK